MATKQVKKTVQVRWILDTINRRLTQPSDAISLDARNELWILLENILIETGNYAGFRYLTSDELPAGEQPGIFIRGATESTPTLFPDVSRRCYYVSNELRRKGE